VPILLIPADQAHNQSLAEPFQVFWGGPDRPARCLRDLLEERIHAVPPGGEILWATYYFRDEKLAMALLQASRRGVRVRIVVEGNPRTVVVNSRARELLGDDNALGKGLRVLAPRLIDNRYVKGCRLHEKLYYFSHPVPSVFVGTFNPSGNIPEDPAIISEIGDQDRGHNVLMEIRDPTLVRALHVHAHHLFKACHGPWERFLPRNNRSLVSGNTRVLFFPRSRWKDFDGLFSGLGVGSHLRMAVSHLSDPDVCERLFGLARQRVSIEILAHDTERRVPAWVEEQIRQSGIVFNRYVHPEGLPMHNKFMLIDTPERRVLAFGSMNLSTRSLRSNHELLVIDETPGLYDLFRRRWDEMLLEVNDSKVMSNSQGPIPLDQVVNVEHGLL